MGKKTFHLFLLLLLTPPIQAAALQPSFDCKKAKTKLEKTICNSQELATYDLILEKAFKDNWHKDSFRDDYRDWKNTLNHCNLKTVSPRRCLLLKYAEMLETISKSHGGFTLPFVPDFECFRPLMPYLNGDQGFYSVRVVSSNKSCGQLRRNLQVSDEGLDRRKVKYHARFKEVISYEIEETWGARYYRHMLRVRFDLRWVKVDGLREPTVVMTLVEH